MDIPRGHAMLPLNETDLLDFIFNYFKAEYSPIRSFWATAAAEPRQPQRWVSMGHELTPLSFRPANAQAQKDLEALDYFIRQKNLDATFVRGIVVRFAKYEVHERLEKRLFESARLDLMVRKALKEKHLIDALWPSPAPRDLRPELLQQGVKVRQWYGDMFSKYFQHLRSLDDFKLRPDVDAKIRSSGTLMLVPFVDHLVFGNVDPIFPIVAKGAGYANSQAWKQKSTDSSFGEPERFEIRFDTPGDVEETQTKTVVRQCRCLKCGTKRDVRVAISIDPTPGPKAPKASAPSGSTMLASSTPASKKRPPKPTNRYSPGYVLPSHEEPSSVRNAEPQLSPPPAEDRPASPEKKKACPRCTFLNHPDLTTCEMCQADLPETLVSSPPIPETRAAKKPSHSHSASLPPPTAQGSRTQQMKEASRPAVNRHSLSSTLFSIFPFSHQHQTEHHANLPPTQPAPTTEEVASAVAAKDQVRPATSSSAHRPEVKPSTERPGTASSAQPPKPPTHSTPSPPSSPHEPTIPSLFQEPELPAMMTLSPSSPLSPAAKPPSGLPLSLTDYDFVPVSAASPSFRNEEEEEEAGWREMSKEEARKDESEDEDEDGADERGLIDLDAVAREEMGVWGEREDDD